MSRAPVRIPVLLRFPSSAARQDGWGRLLDLSAGGARVTTATILSKGERVAAHFELAGERLRACALVAAVARDDDGHLLAELRWTDQAERRVLAKALVDVLARS